MPDMQQMQQMLKSGDFSDLTLKCRGHERRVHRVIVCGQSPVFKAMCSGPFQEASSGVIDLSDHTIVDLDCLLQYLYTRDYSDPATESADAAVSSNADNPGEVMPSTLPNGFNHDMVVDAAASLNVDIPQEVMPSALPMDSTHSPEGDKEGWSAPLRHARMYAIGDRYDIVPLKDLAKSKFGATVYRDGPRTDTFPELIEYVHTSTPESDRGLRDPIQQIIVLSAEYLLMHQDIIEIMLDVPTVAVDMCKGLLAWAETEIKSRNDHIASMQTKHGEEKQRLEQTAAENDIQMKKAEEKLERCKNLAEWLWRCETCRSEFTKTIPIKILDPLGFTECFPCQMSKKYRRAIMWKE
ncbi:hypothetical protein MMC27_002897 [Xylographa pallens]|nr:hypothetical protein [Xylographa pallens]